MYELFGPNFMVKEMPFPFLSSARPSPLSRFIMLNISGPQSDTSIKSAVRQTCIPPKAASRQQQGKLWTNLQELCALLHFPAPASIEEEDALFQHVHFRKCQRIYTIGQPFRTLYIVYSGFLKTVLIDNCGNEQVLNFPMKGDLFGLDGIYDQRYASEAVALSDCEVILLPFMKMTALGRSHTGMDTLMYSLISWELLREQTMISMLGSLSAEAKVARFLLSLSEHFAGMGYSSKLFILRMSRHDIGSYLGLTLETVSRTLTALNKYGFISVTHRTIGICNIDALRTLGRLPASTVGKQPAGAVRVGAQPPADANGQCFMAA
jgi:CRP/FNR family transcriptional regulator